MQKAGARDSLRLFFLKSLVIIGDVLLINQFIAII